MSEPEAPTAGAGIRAYCSCCVRRPLDDLDSPCSVTRREGEKMEEALCLPQPHSRRNYRRYLSQRSIILPAAVVPLPFCSTAFFFRHSPALQIDGGSERRSKCSIQALIGRGPASACLAALSGSGSRYSGLWLVFRTVLARLAVSITHSLMFLFPLLRSCFETKRHHWRRGSVFWGTQASDPDLPLGLFLRPAFGIC